MHAVSVALSGPAVTSLVLCGVSLSVSASARPLQIKLPKISAPKLPDLDLPNFGKKKKPAESKQVPVVRAPPAPGSVKVRAAKGVIGSVGSGDAPTLADVTGETSVDTIAPGAGFKKFPARRMPGANMDAWKEIAKEIGPKI